MLVDTSYIIYYILCSIHCTASYFRDQTGWRCSGYPHYGRHKKEKEERDRGHSFIREFDYIHSSRTDSRISYISYIIRTALCLSTDTSAPIHATSYQDDAPGFTRPGQAKDCGHWNNTVYDSSDSEMEQQLKLRLRLEQTWTRYCCFGPGQTPCCE